MKTGFAGFSKIFSFTFSQQIRGKSYKTSTLVLGLLCLLLPALILSLISASDRGEKDVYVESAKPAEVTIVNEGGFVYDLNHASDVLGVTLVEADDPEQALSETKTLVVVLTRTQSETILFAGQVEEGGGCTMRVLVPEDSVFSKDDASNFAYMLQSALFSLELPEGAVRVAVPPAPEPDEEEVSAESGDGFEGLREILSYVLPYLNIMLLYFLILIYGQGVANSVIMEKTSKLMDSFLIAVRPPAMILGKVLAICLAAALQFACWVVCLLAGLHIFSTVFSIPGLILGLIVILLGFLLYCSLAAVGGALAGKPEDLSSTNMLFTLALIASFFLTLYSGGIGGALGYTSWLCYFPFSAVLVVPGLASLGMMPIANVLISIVILLASSLAIMYLAGRLYKSMAFYRGNPPKINQIFSILKAK